MHLSVTSNQHMKVFTEGFVMMQPLATVFE